jgi:hypothetical protein
MTQPQQQPYTPGQVVDHSRSTLRGRLWPAELVTWTATLTGVPTTGPQGFSINGITLNFDAVVPTDDNDVIMQGLQAVFVANEESIRLGRATVASNVITVQEYAPGAGFVLDSPVATGGTMTLLDTTVATGELLLGIGVALSTTEGQIRRAAPGDTAASLFGVVVEGPGVAANEGDPAVEDHYDVGASVALMCVGEVPVRVEEEIVIGDDVFWRVTATGDEIFGTFRTDDDGGDAVQITNATWTSPSFRDRLGRRVAMLKVSLP